MSVATTLTRLHELACAMPRPECDWEDRPQFGPSATLQSLDEFERIVGFALPGEFREFLLHTESIVAMSVHNGYWLGDIELLIKLVGQRSLPSVVDGEPTIPIATDGGGNVFLLAAIGCVWRWDHETNRLDFVSESFSAFLERVAEDWDAYVSEKPGWHFLV